MPFLIIFLPIFLMLLGQSTQQYTTPCTEEDKRAAVDCHNIYRRNLTLGLCNNNKLGIKMPKASNMYKISWDDELAKLAEAWANKCTLAHSWNGWAGENLAMNGGTFTNKDAFVDACQRWWTKLDIYGINDRLILDDINFGAIGHWTQMAWHNTYKIGCAMAKNCPNTNWKTYTVCWYYSPGNYFGVPVYAVGEPCSACDKGDQCDRAAGLCYKQ